MSNTEVKTEKSFKKYWKEYWKVHKKDIYSWRFVDLAALIIAAITIWYANVQFNDAQNTLNDTRKIVKAIRTNFLANFPDNIELITEKIISPTTNSLTIITDYPIYGIYSKSKASKTYCNKISGIRAIPSVKLRLLYYNYDLRKQRFIDQFYLHKDSLNSEKYFYQKFQYHANKCNKNNLDDNYKCSGCKLLNFIETYNIDSNNIKTCNEFFNSMEQEHKRFIDQLNQGEKENIAIDTTNQALTNAWLSDNEELVFSFTSLGNGVANESSFITQDAAIIQFIKQTYENSTDSPYEYYEGKQKKR